MFDVYATSRGFSPLLAVVEDDGGEVIGFWLAALQHELRGWVGRLTARLVARGTPLAAQGFELAPVVRALDQRAKRRALYSSLAFADEVEGLTALGYRWEPHLNYLFDLRRGADNLWGGLDSSRRKQIRRSERRGVEVCEEGADFDVHRHYGVLEDTYRRVGLPLFDVSLFTSVRDVLGPRNMLRVFGAYAGSELIASRMVLVFRGVVHDWFAGNLASFQDRYPNDALVWAVLRWGAEAGMEQFDFGGAGHPDRPYGVREFKRRFGGQETRYALYRRSFWPLADPLVDVGKSAYRWAMRRFQDPLTSDDRHHEGG